MSRDNSGLSRRKLLKNGVAMSSAAVLAASAGCIGGGDDLLSGELHITQQVEPAHDYDPIILNDAYSGRIAQHIYDGLYEYDAGLTLEPKIATGAPEVSRNGTRFIVEITDEAEFHNGDPVTADDVLHSLIAPVVERTDNLTSYDMIDIDSSDTIDDTSVQFDLLEPYAPFETMTLAASIVNKDERLDAIGISEDDWWSAWENDGEIDSENTAYNKENPIGSGPFQYDGHQDGEFSDLVRWDDYWGEPIPHLEEVRWVATEDDPARTAQLLAGDTDIITGVAPDDYDVVDNDPDVDLHTTLSISYFYACYNINEGPTVERDVRHGVEHAFSMTAFVDEVIGPAGANMYGPIAHQLMEDWGLPIDDYAAMENEYDPERAADLIGPHLDGVWEPVIIAPPDDIRQQLAERMASRLGELSEFGVEIDAQVQFLDWATFLESYSTGNADDYAIYTLGWTGGPDPDAYLWALFQEAGAGITQGHFYDRDGFHDNLRQARETPDFDTRRDLYDEVITEILEEKIHTPGYGMQNSVGALPRVQDLEVHASSSLKPRLVSDYHNVSVE